MHTKARLERPPIYPARAPVEDDQVSWDVPLPDYAPPYFVAPAVLENDRPGGWADPESIDRVSHPFVSLESTVNFDASGRPLNIRGRTGVAGRGLLGRWGANFAADAIITRQRDGHLEMIAIERKDSGQWAIPGGMADGDEDPLTTAHRELKEETGIDLDLSGASRVYQGYVDDRRNTDHAWMETTAFVLHLGEGGDLEPHGADDAAKARWIRIDDDEMLAKLYASHSELVRKAHAQIRAQGSSPQS